jgi:ATP-dependent Clp protease ATP-binding subunit ClpA
MAGMFDRFTDRSLKVMALARKEAQRFNRDAIGTEHILLGLLAEGAGVAANVLKNRGASISGIRAALEKGVELGPHVVTTGLMPFTPRARQALELSMEEANELGHNYIGTEHLLLGVLRESGGRAAKVLSELGISAEEVRKETIALLGGEISTATNARKGPMRVPSRRPSGSRSSSLLAQCLRALAIARAEAARLGQVAVGPEHLLLGLLLEPEGLAGAVLRGLGLIPHGLSAVVEGMGARGSAGMPPEGLPLGPAAARALEGALEEAAKLDHAWLSTEHLLVALLRDGEGAAAQALRAAGVDPAIVSASVLDSAPPGGRIASAERPERPRGLLARLWRAFGRSRA